MNSKSLVHLSPQRWKVISVLPVKVEMLKNHSRVEEDHYSVIKHFNNNHFDINKVKQFSKAHSHLYLWECVWLMGGLAASPARVWLDSGAEGGSPVAHWVISVISYVAGEERAALSGSFTATSTMNWIPKSPPCVLMSLESYTVKCNKDQATHHLCYFTGLLRSVMLKSGLL